MIVVIYDETATPEQIEFIESKSIAEGWVIIKCNDGNEWPHNRLVEEGDVDGSL